MMPTLFERAWRILFMMFSFFLGRGTCPVVELVEVVDVEVVFVYTNNVEKNVVTVCANRAKAFGLSDLLRRLRNNLGRGRQAIFVLEYHYFLFGSLSN